MIRSIAQGIEQREFVQTGTFVLKQGMVGSNAYMIESGKIEISVKDPDGDDVHLAELGPGELVGEMAAMFGGRRCATACALEDCVLIAIPGRDLQETVRKSSGLYDFVMNMVTERARDMQTKILKKQQEKLAGGR